MNVVVGVVIVVDNIAIIIINIITIIVIDRNTRETQSHSHTNTTLIALRFALCAARVRSQNCVYMFRPPRKVYNQRSRVLYALAFTERQQ